MKKNFVSIPAIALLLCFSLSALLLQGCPADTETDIDPNVKNEKKEVEKDLGPVATMELLRDSLANKDFVTVWNMLPADYQTGINEVAQKFGNKMDADMYTKIFALLKKAQKLTVDKKDFILELAKDSPSAPKIEDQDKAYDKLTSGLASLVNSDYADIENVKKFDGEKFVSGTITPLVTSFIEVAEMTELSKSGGSNPLSKMDQIKKSTFELVSEEGDKATVKVMTEGEEPEEMVLIKVDGKWLPEEMNKEKFLEGKKKALSSLEDSLTPDTFKSISNQFNTMANILDSTIDQMNESETKEEFQAAAIGAMGPIMMIGPSMFQGNDKGLTPPEKVDEKKSDSKNSDSEIPTPEKDDK